MSLEQFLDETYPQIWREAWQLGRTACEEGLSRECDLSDDQFITPSGAILKVYQSAWEQGWDGRNPPPQHELHAYKH